MEHLENGKWLEHAVYEALRACATTCKLHDIRLEVKTGISNADFEVDVMALRGHQLFAFSCTTSAGEHTRSQRKLKLFEAYVRADQLGGGESCAALVSVSDDNTALKSELVSGIMPEDRIEVFGREHLSDLTSALQRWIEKQSSGK